MASYYIDFVNGNDSNAGSLGAPKQTLLGFNSAPTITLADGDRIGYMNTGAHPWAVNANEYTITKSVTIFGCTTGGAAASATISATVTGARRHILAGAGSAITIENIVLDATTPAVVADAAVYDFIRYSSSTGLMSFRGVSFLPSAIGGGAPGNFRRLINTITNPGTGVAVASFHRCYFQNATGFGAWNTANNETYAECVFIGDLASLAWINKNITGGTTTVTNCTWYVVLGAVVVGAPVTLNNTSGSAVVTAHSNIIYANSTLASTLITFLRDSAGAGTLTGTKGFNVLQGGSDVSGAGEILNNGWYERNHDPDNNDGVGSDTYATDQVAYGVAPSTLFNNPSGSYNWDTVNGIAIALPKDLRPRLYLASSQSGGVPGALPAASTDYGVSIDTSNTAPEPGDAVTLTVTASNTGTDATSVTMTATIPAGTTLVLATPGTGSYNSGTGLWTIGSLASGGSATLTLALTIDADQAGNDIVATASTTSGDPANDTNSANNTDSVTMSVVLDQEEDPGETPFLDVAPIFAPVLKAEVNAIMRLFRNRLQQQELRSDIESRDWREYAARRLALAPSATHEVITGIERIDILVLEATGAIDVSISDSSTDRYFPGVQRLALLNADFTTLKLRNNGTASVDVLLVVVD